MDKDRRIDRNKVRAHARKLDGADMLVWLDRAIDLLPEDALPELIADYVHLHKVLADSNTPPDLLHEIRQFHRDSMAGRYYQDFDVNSRNYLDQSRGTERFIAEHTRLVEVCLKAEQRGELDTAAQGLRLLIGLLREIDRGQHEIVFFADESASWQVGVEWARVLPAWFRSLSPALDPYPWAETVVETLEAFGRRQTRDLLAVVREVGTPAQRSALAEYEEGLLRYR